jgi:glutaredoxin-like protein
MCLHLAAHHHPQAKGSAMTFESILVYGADWCGDCRRARRFLNLHNIPYQWIDIDRDEQGEQFVLDTNRGQRSIPTLLFADGSTLVEPSNLALAEKLGIPEYA